MGKLKVILKLITPLLYVFSGLLCVPLFFGLAMGDSILPFFLPAVLTLVLGLSLSILLKRVDLKVDLVVAMLLTSVAWFLLSFIGGLPYVIGLGKGLVDATFESVSAFTTTGITVFKGLDDMPKSILLWRSMSQWLGGLGILTFFLLIASSSEGEIWQLFSAEGHKINASRPVPNVFTTIRIFWLIYGVFTLIEIILLWLLGLSTFDALNHSLTSLSTGGFSTHDASIAYYQAAGYVHYKWIEYVIILFMALGGINFLVHFKAASQGPKAYYRDPETKGYLGIILSFTGLTLVGIWMARGLPWSSIEETLRKTLFQMVSLITTTGFGTEDIGSDFFPVISRQLFLLLMIIGGSVGSTAGGIKVLRTLVLGKSIKREITKIRLPRKAVLPITLGGTLVDDQEVTRISGLIFAWMILVVVGSWITVLFSDLGALEGFSGMASAVGNIGPFYFSVDKMISLSPVIKVTYIIGMLAGRLELIPLMIVFTRKSWR